MEGEKRVNRLKVQREERRRERRDIYKDSGVPYALPAVCLDISSVRSMQQSAPDLQTSYNFVIQRRQQPSV